MIGKEIFRNLDQRDPDKQTPQRDIFCEVTLWGATTIRMQDILKVARVYHTSLTSCIVRDVVMLLMALARGAYAMAHHRNGNRDPKVTLVRAHSYLTDNAIIDEYGPKIGAHGVAVYHALNRFADRQTGICWPKIKTIGARILLSESSVKRSLQTLKAVGLITIDPRWSDDGDPTSNLFTLIPLATLAKRQQAAAAAAESPTVAVSDGGGVPLDPPPITEGGEVGSEGTHHAEQDTQNKNTSSSSDDEKMVEHKNTCPHPQHDVSHFDGMSICYHCWTILEERGVVAASHEVHTPAEEVPCIPAA